MEPFPVNPLPPARLPALDGARGIAVLLVLFDHASDANMQIFTGADVNRAGKYGVYLFFVLSAFLVRLLRNLPPFLLGSVLAIGHATLQRHPRHQ